MAFLKTMEINCKKGRKMISAKLAAWLINTTQKADMEPPKYCYLKDFESKDTNVAIIKYSIFPNLREAKI